jgi:sulfide:quinone oxidoreductase
MNDTARGTNRLGRRRVVIAGGGVAGLETLLALRALAADRLDITLVAPEAKFVNRSMTVEQPFKPKRVRGLRLENIAVELGARWHRGSLDRVEHEQRRVVTKGGDRLGYDMLVLALGAHPAGEWRSADVLTYRDGRDAAAYRLLLHQLRAGRVRSLAFVRPSGASWPMPLYDLALMTARDRAVHERDDVNVSLITPEEHPLGIFGGPVGAAVRRLFRESRVALHTSSYVISGRPGWLAISPGRRRLAVDRIVTVPRLIGPRLRGIPCVRDGFIPTDAHGRLVDLEGVFATGDATVFPIKHGGVAAQQAGAVAEAIAASAGVDIDPRPFRPTLYGVLLTGRRPRYLRADISGEAGDDSTMSPDPLWWPPNKLHARRLTPYLSRQAGAAADGLAPVERVISSNSHPRGAVHGHH